jgi:flavin-binding protein dodecin
MIWCRLRIFMIASFGDERLEEGRRARFRRRRDAAARAHAGCEYDASFARSPGARRLRFTAIEENAMSANTYKLIELVGTSPNSCDEAIRNAIAKAGSTVKNMDWFEVVDTRGHIAGDRVAHYQVTLKVGFRIED